MTKEESKKDEPNVMVLQCGESIKTQGAKDLPGVPNDITDEEAKEADERAAKEKIKKAEAKKVAEAKKAKKSAEAKK